MSGLTDVNLASVMIAVITLTIVLALGFEIYTTIDSRVTQEYLNQSHQWCQDHGGELYFARVVGEHGGVHCRLENGTSVHMHEVINTGDLNG